MLVIAVAKICLFLPTFSNNSEAIETPLSSLSETPTVEEAKLAVSYIAKEYNLPEMIDVVRCESGFEYDADNPDSSAFGIAQFMPFTFEDYCVGDYNSPKDQLVCMASMWQKGLHRHWECYTLIYGNQIAYRGK